MGFLGSIRAPLLFALSLPLPLAGAVQEPIRTAHRPGELLVDGALGDWAGIDELPGSGDGSTDTARVSLAWDQQALYAALEVSDPQVVAGAVGDDPFAVDRVELRFDVDGSGGALGEGDLRVLVGCNGSVMVFRSSGSSPDGRTVMTGMGQVAGLRAAARSRPGGYDVELALPTSLVLDGEPRAGTTLALDVLLADGARGDASEPHLSETRWSWSGATGTNWTRIALEGGPSLLQYASRGAPPWLLALLASLLAAGGTAAVFSIRQRRQLARFQALTRRLEQLEQGADTGHVAAPKVLPVVLESVPAGDLHEQQGTQPEEPESPASEPGLPATVQDSSTAELRSMVPRTAASTIRPFDQDARDLAERIAELMQRESDGEVTGSSEWQELAEMALAYVQLHLSENLAVTDLADALHTTPRTLQRGFKRALDCTPRELLLTVRMREAKRLLKTGLHRVSEVAYQVGFEDPAHFSRRFKAYYGRSPSDLAQHYRDAANPDPTA